MNKVQFDLPAGVMVSDKFSNITGIIVSRAQRINGCLQYVVKRLDKNGEPVLDWYDADDLTLLSKRKVKNPFVVFKFKTGDKVENPIHKKTGIVTVAKHDKNGCIGYFYETGETHPQTGKTLEFYGFEQEFEFIDDGLNKKEIARKKTGAVFTSSSGKY